MAEAIFLNREELPVYPLYYDPIHDFAFVRFDPSQLQFMDVGEVPLAPEGATVGLDIRVVGNDSGEKVRARRMSPPWAPSRRRVMPSLSQRSGQVLLGLSPLAAESTPVVAGGSLPLSGTWCAFPTASWYYGLATGVHPGGHPGTPGPRRSSVRPQGLQRLQHVSRRGSAARNGQDG